MESPLTDIGVRVLALDDAEAIAGEFARAGISAAGDAAARAMLRLVRLDRAPGACAHALRDTLRAAGGEALCDDAALARGLPVALVLVGTAAQYRAVSDALQRQGGALARLAVDIQAALAHYDRHDGVLRCGPHTLPLGAKTYIMGILNVTPDSFSGDGLASVDAALRQAERMLDEGADILDVGGESTRPRADAVPLEKEMRRVLPVVRALAARFPVPISVDTTKSAVARQALAAGATMVNDISGLCFDPAMARTAAEAGAAVVVMHMQGTPRTMQQRPHYDDLLRAVCDALQAATARAVAAGLPRGQVILDPGYGFGKTVAHNLELLRRLRELTSYGQPILIGTSRKSSIGVLLGGLPPEERVEGTAATVALAIAHGADIVRVHDVRAMARVATVADVVMRGRPAPE